MDEETLEDALIHANWACAPATLEEVEVALSNLMTVYGADPDWCKGNADMYMEVLSTLPRDLLALAVRRVLTLNKWRPKPAEIREAVAAEFYERRQSRSMLRLALRQMQATRGEMVA